MALLENVIGRGPASAIPAAGAAGALYCETDTGRVRRDNGLTWDIIAGGGTPTLRGPYVVNYTDIPTDGSTMDLWTPQVGDVLLRLFPDWQTVMQWDTGKLSIGQNVDGPAGHNSFDWAADHAGGGIGYSTQGGLDNVTTAIAGDTADAVGNPVFTTAYVFHTTDPVQIQMYGTGGTDPSMGHVELYALIATAIAP